MSWSETIRFDRPLRAVHCVAGAPQAEWPLLWERSLQQAREEGRSEGERTLREQLIQQRNELAQFQQGVLETLRRAVPEVLRQAESLLVPLALEAARRVVAGLPIDVTLVEQVVRETLQQVQDRAEVTIRLHPEDLALLQRHGSELLQASLDTGALRFVAAPEVSRGGCVVLTRFGRIDAQRETKLEQLQQALLA